jgi:molybdopterin-containing oxidoreductase family iron-sulfur binding subunit
MDAKNAKAMSQEICPSKKGKLDLEQVRAQVAATKGPEYWRSLEELAGSAEFQAMLHREFPKGASEWLDTVSRRGFLRLMGASLALAGMTACTRQPLEPIVPYVRQPEDVVPGRAKFYATAMTLAGYGKPLLVESQMGRPTKVEGNPEHPASLGGTDIFAQASILEMYDPDRSQTVTYLGDVRSWGAFLQTIRGALNAQKSLGGAGIRLLTQAISSPTLADQVRGFLQLYPQAKWHQYEPVNRDAAWEGSKLAFGEAVETQYRLENADVVLSLDADFLDAAFPGFTRYARDFAKRRDPDSGKMNRLYVVESAMSPTGARADHRLPLRYSEVEGFARALATKVGAGSAGSNVSGEAARWIDALAEELQQHRGSCLVIAGEQQSPAVHALAHALNQALGNVGHTLVYTQPVHANPVNHVESLRDLVADMRAGKVDFLAILGGNPAYDAPADFDFADALKNTKIPIRVHLGLYQNETAALCQWHVNEAHYLEAWGDVRAYDGTVSIVQPLIAPLYAGKSAHEFLGALMGHVYAQGYELVRSYWQKQSGAADFENWWRRSVHDGYIAGSAFPVKSVTAKPISAAPPAEQPGIEVAFRCDPTVHDGRFANNGWLQELPKPMSKMTWDNPVWLSPKTADSLGVRSEDVVEISVQGAKVTGAVWVQAGHPDNAVTLFLGYGRTRAGRAGTGMGFDFYPLRTTTGMRNAPGAQIRKTGDTYKLATTQGYQTMDTPIGARPLVRAANLEEYRKEPEFAKEDQPSAALTLYPDYGYQQKEYAWGMAIDMNACVGCNNCILACQSENNVPVVGKEQVVRGRHMHWLRVDAYYQGDRSNPKAYFQPVPCMQCENAPCEVVCPVGATVHSSEGLNDMVYNRCVGTRYCSDNCPYKVRRFNFLLFQDWDTQQYKMMRNPDVSVRSRGVMEKCTYCVQRINEGRIDAERADRTLRDGEVQTACQQSCPADAIVFGNINDPSSRVSQLKARNLNYSLLGDLNTRPRTTYLAAIRNPNPKLVTERG